jgi:hypothetical protein
MSRIYVRIWEETNNSKLPKNKEIHHIDGKRTNNASENLLAVTIEEHLLIHEQQNDFAAVQAILMRMERTEENILKIRNAASKHQTQLWENGNHNFQIMTGERRREISREAGKKTLEDKIGIHAINNDPILSKENARRGGLAAKEKQSGFLNTNSKNHGSKHVKNTVWWINQQNIKKRSTNCPGEGWKRGMVWK